MPSAWRALLVIALVVTGMHVARPAFAQTNEDLATGRKLFAEALDDEDHKRFAAALEKYQKVAAIKDTCPVRYHIATTLESLGKPTQAIEAYSAAIKLAGPADSKIVKESKARIEVLEPKVAHLTIRVRTSPETAEVRVDDQVVPPAALEDTRIDPGNHTIVVNAPGMLESRASVTLTDGGRAEIPVVLQPKPPPPQPYTTPPPEPAPASPNNTPRPLTIGVAALGGVLIASGFVVLGLRASAISDLEESCPGGDCPASRKDELLSTQNRANAEGPIAGALLGVGVIALGAAVYLYFRDRSHTAGVAAR